MPMYLKPNGKRLYNCDFVDEIRHRMEKEGVRKPIIPSYIQRSNTFFNSIGNIIGGDIIGTCIRAWNEVRTEYMGDMPDHLPGYLSTYDLRMFDMYLTASDINRIQVRLKVRPDNKFVLCMIKRNKNNIGAYILFRETDRNVYTVNDSGILPAVQGRHYSFYKAATDLITEKHAKI